MMKIVEANVASRRESFGIVFLVVVKLDMV